MEERDWLILKVLHKTKNITRAAKEVYLSQPALTTRLQYMERDFDVKIVNRTSKGIVFTPEGEYLVQHGNAILEKIDDLKKDVKEITATFSGTVAIGASSYFTLYSLPGLLESFKQQFPQVKFSVTTDWSKNISSEVYKNHIQVGFASVDYEMCKNKYLLYEEPICAAFRDEFTLADLPNLPRITYQSDYILKSQLDKWWCENYPVPPNVNMHVNVLHSCLHMVQYGLGYALLPLRILENDNSLHKIVLKDACGKPLIRKAWMLYSDDAPYMSTVNQFVEFAKTYDFEGNRNKSDSILTL